MAMRIQVQVQLFSPYGHTALSKHFLNVISYKKVSPQQYCPQICCLRSSLRYLRILIQTKKVLSPDNI